MKTCPTYQVSIYMGLQTGYSGKIHRWETAFDVCQNYCNEIHLGLTFTQTKFLYVDGNEIGFIVGLINYPRFPETEGNIRTKAIDLAKILMKKLEQERCSVVTPFQTFMLEKDDL